MLSNQPQLSLACDTCGANLSKPPSQIRGKRRLFCSRACMGISQRITPADRIARHIDRSGGIAACWPWTAKRNGADYGVFEYIGQSYGAHRVAWEIANGRFIPRGMIVRHLCPGGGNPWCCNPAHLALGTHQDNSDDKAKDGHVLTGEQHPRAKLTTDVVLEIRRRDALGESHSSIARTLNTPRGNVVNVVHRRCWTHVSDDNAQPAKGARP